MYTIVWGDFSKIIMKEKKIKDKLVVKEYLKLPLSKMVCLKKILKCSINNKRIQ